MVSFAKFSIHFIEMLANRFTVKEVANSRLNRLYHFVTYVESTGFAEFDRFCTNDNRKEDDVFCYHSSTIKVSRTLLS